MDIKQLMREHDELLGKRQAIYDKAGEEKRGLTEEEKAADEQLKTRADEMAANIDTLKEIQDQRAGNPPEVVEELRGRPQVQDPNQARADAAKWGSFGEQLQAVARAELSGQVDRRLVVSSEERQMGMSEGVPSDGGFLVQTDFITELLKLTHDASVLAPKTRLISVGPNSNGLTINAIDEKSRATGSRWGGVKGYWLAEAGTKTASHPTLRQMELKLKKMAALCYATDESLQDASTLEGLIRLAFSEEFAFMLDDAIFEGNGVGQPLGIMNSPALVTVAAEVGQPANTILFENIVNMWSRAYGRSRPSMAWLINQDIEPQLFAMSLAVGVGGIPVYLPANGLSGSPYGSLLGRPVIPIEYASTLGTTGDIMLADLSQYLRIDKSGAGGGIQAATSIHVKFLYDETAFRFVYRVGGQPMWTLPLTPFKGANTLSPFIVLATRA